MPEREHCGCKIFRETWRILKGAKSLEEARSMYKQFVLKFTLKDEGV